ncbi:expressed unknown protein [Seminavis robusta]|uniref:Uncharacterized protein n=1 Tax=Seminavis robusta TaxID=568900 RepID=A0A9N8DS22_9STRA|nr:expressed unknown protein [Seminavis robusta]|eukprot:Sro311_g114350.1 n/a (540) ;mRNA; f:54445-56148
MASMTATTAFGAFQRVSASDRRVSFTQDNKGVSRDNQQENSCRVRTTPPITTTTTTDRTPTAIGPENTSDPPLLVVVQEDPEFLEILSEAAALEGLRVHANFDQAVTEWCQKVTDNDHDDESRNGNAERLTILCQASAVEGCQLPRIDFDVDWKGESLAMEECMVEAVPPKAVSPKRTTTKKRKSPDASSHDPKATTTMTTKKKATTKKKPTTTKKTANASQTKKRSPAKPKASSSPKKKSVAALSKRDSNKGPPRGVAAKFVSATNQRHSLTGARSGSQRTPTKTKGQSAVKKSTTTTARSVAAKRATGPAVVAQLPADTTMQQPTSARGPGSKVLEVTMADHSVAGHSAATKLSLTTKHSTIAATSSANQSQPQQLPTAKQLLSTKTNSQHGTTNPPNQAGETLLVGQLDVAALSPLSFARHGAPSPIRPRATAMNPITSITNNQPQLATNQLQLAVPYSNPTKSNILDDDDTACGWEGIVSFRNSRSAKGGSNGMEEEPDVAAKKPLSAAGILDDNEAAQGWDGVLNFYQRTMMGS